MDLFTRKKSTKEMVQGASKRPPREKPERPRPPDKAEKRPLNVGGVFKSRTFIAVICIFLSFVIGLVLLPRFYRARSATESVILLRADVETGTVISKEMITPAEVGSYGLPAGVVKSVDDAVGMVASSELYQGEFLWSDRLMSAEDYEAARAEQSKGLTGGNRLVTITPYTASAGVAGVLRAGDVVDVYECKKGEDGEYSTVKVLNGLKIYDVFNDDFESLGDLDEKAAEEQNGNVNYDFNPAYVVFSCTEAQAATLIRLEKAGTLHMTLKSTGG